MRARRADSPACARAPRVRGADSLRTLEAGRRAGRTRHRGAPPQEGPGHHVTRSGGASMRRYGVVVCTGITVAGALAAWLLLRSQDVSGGPVPPPDLGPIPCQPMPPDIVAHDSLEKLGKLILYDC